MSIDAKLARALVATGLALVFAVMPACKRAPEEPAPAAGPGTAEPELDLVTLDLPLSNLDLGVTLTAAPTGMVATYNDGPAIEVVDPRRPNLRFTFFADLAGLPFRSPATVADFEGFIGKHNQGRLTDDGDLETALGPATWANGSYFEEDQSFEDLRVFVAHPSGTGTLIVAAVGPEGVSSLEERLAVIQELLTFVS
ncbi:MAG: hypothetical protein AB1Z65_12425 [Candidatus Sulfomarinibacteraceae bacterium]